MNYDFSILSGVLDQYSSGDFATIAVVTFFLCEAVFAALPIERARIKQLISILIGGVLGLLLHRMPSLVDSVIQGILAGGATTIAVAKFKKPSVPTTDIASVPHPVGARVDPVSSHAPVEHL